ncbi:MarR family winged helix-turn-helix transcriptional regulator [Microbispora triticiradicis]|nr:MULTISPECIES: MarR family transcriptional regulator [Microbispora]GLW25405.1 MarR family transcriptional regulator [Microbispora amethystogenes]
MRDPDFPVRQMMDQWAARRPDLDPRPMALFGRLTRADTLANGAIAATLRAHGLNRGEFDVLATLYRGGEEMSAGALAGALLLSPAATTNRLDRLQAAGLLARLPDPEDGRGVRVRLTDAGRDLLKRSVEDHVRGLESLLALLSPDEREQLSALLARLLHSMAALRD